MIFRSDFFICERCESIQVPNDSNAKNDDHKWWHSLLVLRKSLIEPVFSLEAASHKVETTGTQAETQSAAADSDHLHTDDGDPDTNPHSALISEAVMRISAVEDKFHVALTVMEDKSDSTRLALEGQLTSIEERVVKLDDLEKMVAKLDDIGERMGKLDYIGERMAKLDDIGEEMAKLDDIEKMVVKPDDIEERMRKLDYIGERMRGLSDIEEKLGKLDDIEQRVEILDEKIAELKEMLQDLMGRLNT